MAVDNHHRGAESLPQTLGRQFHYVDEIDIGNLFIQSNTLDMAPDTSAMLSPVEEEKDGIAWDAPLAVHVHIEFYDPAIRSVYNRTYYSSQSFVPTDRICRGLLRRIRHCSEELITRWDPDALSPTRCLFRRRPESPRFELTFNIQRRGHPGTWAERVFPSYQKHALTSASAVDVARSTHGIVGLFLRRHDEGFQWSDEPAAHDEHSPLHRPETFQPPLAGPLDLRCIPRGPFAECPQAWQSVPGYSLELTLESNNPARHQPEVTRRLRVDSTQPSPLHLGLSEDLLWQAYRSVQDVLDQKKNTFDLAHAGCNDFDGLPDGGCQHFDENALDVELRVCNNLGPVYEHLHRSIHSRLRLFTCPDGQDCDELVSRISGCFAQFRDRTDRLVDRLPDVDFRIAELIGHGWHAKNCARFTVDGTQRRSRRTVEALLDRLRTGVRDVLRAHDVAVRMVAYTRGHLVLDKALIARHHKQAPVPESFNLGQDQQHVLLARLRTRIQRDIDVICSDTCNLDDVSHGPHTPEQPPRHTRPRYSPGRPYTPRPTGPYFSYQTGSPANFATCPATPPEVPFRESSRVFPLVPARYKEKGPRAQGMPVITVQDPAADGLQSDNRSQARRSIVKLGSAIHLRPTSTNHKAGAHDDFSDRHVVCGLRPAAEVYPVSTRLDYDTDSNSTHSSMPALTESDTSSPDQSMLITPNIGRSSPPLAHSIPFRSGSDASHLSTPWMAVAEMSAPNSTTFPEVERFAEVKPAVPRSDEVPNARPVTPSSAKADSSAPVDTPRALMSPSGDEKTPLAHRHMLQLQQQQQQQQGPTVPEPPQDLAAPRELNPPEITPPQRLGGAPQGPISGEREGVAPGCSGSVTAGQDLPAEGWLLHCVEATDNLDDVEAHKGHEDIVGGVGGSVGAAAGVDPSETTLNDSTAADHQGSLDQNTGHELSLFDFAFPQPEKDINTIGLEMIQHSDPIGHGEVSVAPDQLVGMSDGPETEDEIPSSNSGLDAGTGSDASEAFSSEIDENASDFGSDKSESVLNTSAQWSEPARGTAPAPPDNTCIRRRDASDATLSSDAILPGIVGTEEPPQEPGLADRPRIPVPTEVLKPAGSSKTQLSAPTVRNSTRSVPNPHPYAVHVGLGNNVQLLPPLPILTSFAPSKTTADSRASWSSSSTWEDYVSSGRQSSDSVDTINPSPAAAPSCQNRQEDGHGDEGLHSAKHLGAPTAGLLGLRESRWADFGIRTALTGTHAFDLPSTAPEAESAVRGHGDNMIKKNSRQATAAEAGHCAQAFPPAAPETSSSPSSPRRIVLVKHKKSLGSMINPSKAHRSSKKEGRELMRKKKQEQKMKEGQPDESIPVAADEERETAVAERSEEVGMSRFPAAMMLVAGLAIASSVVGRSHS